VPLSEHEQRLFDQIEQSLAKDPKFASAVRASDPKHHAKRRVYAAVLLGVVGLVVVVLGVGRSNPLIGVGGFVVMLAAAAFGLTSARRGSTTPLRSVGGTAARSTRRNRMSVIDRLEQRWRDRGDNVM
jgi:hypothetical protein